MSVARGSDAGEETTPLAPGKLPKKLSITFDYHVDLILATKNQLATSATPSESSFKISAIIWMAKLTGWFMRFMA